VPLLEQPKILNQLGNPRSPCARQRGRARRLPNISSLPKI
jgi:hypothetical protein